MKALSYALLSTLFLGLLATCGRPTYTGSEPPQVVADALAQAKSDGKPVLFDLFATW